jgi:hypothetical protein
MNSILVRYPKSIPYAKGDTWIANYLKRTLVKRYLDRDGSIYFYPKLVALKIHVHMPKKDTPVGELCFSPAPLFDMANFIVKLFKGSAYEQVSQVAHIDIKRMSSEFHGVEVEVTGL